MVVCQVGWCWCRDIGSAPLAGSLPNVERPLESVPVKFLQIIRQKRITVFKKTFPASVLRSMSSPHLRKSPHRWTKSTNQTRNAKCGAQKIALRSSPLSTFLLIPPSRSPDCSTGRLARRPRLRGQGKENREKARSERRKRGSGKEVTVKLWR